MTVCKKKSYSDGQIVKKKSSVECHFVKKRKTLSGTTIWRQAALNAYFQNFVLNNNLQNIDTE